MAYDSASYEESYSGGESALGKSYSARLARDRDLIVTGRVRGSLQPFRRVVLRLLKEELEPGSAVLDIGCGSGIFLAAVREAGFRAHGMDVASAPIELLRELGFPVLLGTIRDYPREWPRPAAVTMLEVLEHLADPVASLRNIRETFQSAILICSVPSPYRWTLRGNARETSDYPPNHLTRWSEQALSTAFEKAGYVSRILRPAVHPSQLHSGFDKHLRLRVAARVSPGRSSHWLHSLLRRAKRVVYYPFALSLRLRGYTDHSLVAIGHPEPDTVRAASR